MIFFVSYTGVPKVMVIFTDGNPDSVDLTRLAADRAKKSNITIFAIGIGSSIDQNNLKEMASQESYVIPVSSYEDLIEFTDKINSKTCSVPQTPDIGYKVENDELGKNEKRYFKFPIPSGGITIKIDNSMGKIQGMPFILSYQNVHILTRKIHKTNSGYYSYITENPSSAIHDGGFTVDVFIAPLKTDKARIKRDHNSAGTVHLTMQGQEDKNVYSLDTIEGDHTSGGNQLKTSMLCIITIFMLFINFF